MTGMGRARADRGARAMAPVFAATAALMLALVFSAQALALKPTGDFVNFGDCPTNNPATVGCVFAQSTSGEFKIGSTAVPLRKP
jgi:hypothetical protein